MSGTTYRIQVHDRLCLGVDAGLDKTGWAFVTSVGGCHYSCVLHGTIKTDPQKPLISRLQHITNYLLYWATDCEPAFLAMERVSPENTSHCRENTKVHDAIKSEFYPYQSVGLGYYIEVTNFQIKQAVTGRINASDEQLEQKISRMLKDPQSQPPTHWEIKAAGCAIAALQQIIRDATQPKHGWQDQRAIGFTCEEIDLIIHALDLFRCRHPAGASDLYRSVIHYIAEDYVCKRFGVKHDRLFRKISQLTEKDIRDLFTTIEDFFGDIEPS